MSDNMCRCLRKAGIWVALVKPGNIATAMNAIGALSTRVVATDIKHAIASSTPKAGYYLGKVKGHSCKFICQLYDLLPESLSDNLNNY